MDNILYLDDYINLYNKKKNLLLIVKPYKNTLNNGIIVDREKFIKKLKKILNEYKIGGNIFSENIYIISNNLYNNEIKKYYEEIFKELNYKNIIFKNENSYIKITKDSIYINYNKNYFYITYLNYKGNIVTNIYNNDEINKSIINEIIKKFKNIYVYGKKTNELEIQLQKKNIDYYTFSEKENLIIKIILNEKLV